MICARRPVICWNDVSDSNDFAGLDSSKGWVDTQQREHEWMKHASRQYSFCSPSGQMRPVIARFRAVESFSCG